MESTAEEFLKQKDIDGFLAGSNVSLKPAFALLIEIASKY